MVTGRLETADSCAVTVIEPTLSAPDWEAGVNVTDGRTTSAALNSEVFPNAVQAAPSVHPIAVDVRMSPQAPPKLWTKFCEPPPGWFTLTELSNVSPSPYPDGSAPEGFLKNSTR